MKKLLLIMAAASLLFTQCKKEDSAPSEGKTVNMTVTVGPGGKTDITDMGAITWSENDKIYVGDGSKYVGYLTIASGVGSATGTFTGSVELTDADEDKELTFHFYYLGSADHTDLAKNATSVDVDFSSQDIIKGTDGKLTNASKQHVGYGSAKGTVIGGAVTDINVMMVSKVAIARFNFEKGVADYKGALKLSGTNICNKMTVKFNSTEFACEGTKGDISLTDATSSEKYVMLVSTSETTGKQTLTFAGDNVSGSYTLANGIVENKFYGMKDAIAVTLEAAATKFSVGENTTVEFAPGNLWYGKAEGEETAAFHFEADQWETQPTSDGQWVSSHVSHFYWSEDAAEAIKEDFNWGQPMSTGDVFFTNSTETTANPDFHVNGETGTNTWRTLSKAEWDYLLNTRCNNNASSLREWKDFGNGVKGLVILPDGTDASVMESISSTADLASSGAVFLPASGYRYGTDVNGVGSYGYYWSSTLIEGIEVYAFYMYFDSGLAHSDYDDRYFGYAVRLVR